MPASSVLINCGAHALFLILRLHVTLPYTQSAKTFLKKKNILFTVLSCDEAKDKTWCDDFVYISIYVSKKKIFPGKVGSYPKLCCFSGSEK